MAVPLEHNIREAVLHYIAGRIRLDEFQEWLAANAWDIREQPSDVQQLVNEIELLLAEFSNGHWTEAELRDKLQQYRRVVQPMQAVTGILWAEVRAPYVHVATSGTQGGYSETTYPGSAPPASNPKLEPSPISA